MGDEHGRCSAGLLANRLNLQTNETCKLRNRAPIFTSSSDAFPTHLQQASVGSGFANVPLPTAALQLGNYIPKPYALPDHPLYTQLNHRNWLGLNICAKLWVVRDFSESAIPGRRPGSWPPKSGNSCPASAHASTSHRI